MESGERIKRCRCKPLDHRHLLPSFCRMFFFLSLFCFLFRCQLREKWVWFGNDAGLFAKVTGGSSLDRMERRKRKGGLISERKKGGEWCRGKGESQKHRMVGYHSRCWEGRKEANEGIGEKKKGWKKYKKERDNQSGCITWREEGTYTYVRSERTAEKTEVVRKCKAEPLHWSDLMGKGNRTMAQKIERNQDQRRQTRRKVKERQRVECNWRGKKVGKG